MRRLLRFTSATTFAVAPAPHSAPRYCPPSNKRRSGGSQSTLRTWLIRPHADFSTRGPTTNISPRQPLPVNIQARTPRADGGSKSRAENGFASVLATARGVRATQKKHAACRSYARMVFPVGYACSVTGAAFTRAPACHVASVTDVGSRSRPSLTFGCSHVGRVRTRHGRHT